MFEQFWLVFAIASFLYACYMVYLNGAEQEGKNFIIPIIAIVWWYFRRFMRKRLERNMQNRQPNA